MANRVPLTLQRAVPFVDSASRSLGMGAMFKILRALFLSKEVWIQNILGFLAARAGVLGGLFPFGPAFFAAALVAGDRRKAVAVGISVIAGAATVLPWYRVATLAIAVFGALLLIKEPSVTRSKGRANHPWVSALATALLFGAARAVPGWVQGLTWHEGISTSVEAGLIGIIAVLLIPVATVDWLQGTHRFERETLVALGLLVAAAGLGLHPGEWGWVRAAEVWNRWVTLLAALIGAGAAGAAMGTFLGVLASLTGWLPLGGMGLYGVSGLFAGLFARKGKIGVAFGFILGQMTVSVHAAGPDEILLGAAHTGLALGLIALTPRRWIARISRSVPGSDVQAALQLAKERRLREAINERLRKIGTVFNELADVFAGPHLQKLESVGSEDGFHALVESVWTAQCRGCSGFSKCWETQFYRSYWDMVDLVAVAERNGSVGVSDLPPGLAGRCFQRDDFVRSVNSALECGRTARRRSGTEALDVVPQQLRGVAELIENIAGQVKIDTGRAEEIEAHLREEFSLGRVGVNEVRVTHAGDHPEVEVEYAGPCDGCGSCAEGLVHVLERALADRYSAASECRETADGTCRVRLVPEPSSILRVEVARLAKGETSVSGDTYTRLDLGGGKLALVLSDGMGVGDRAALESRATVGMLEKMMRAGFDRAFAAHTVNAVLLMRSTEEMFATVDLAVIDQFSGEAEFLKVGSSPTFIKRGREVEIVHSESLPVGILNDIDVYANVRLLQDGDVLVMMTDGILDALPQRQDKEEWIARMLRREETQDPQALVGLLVERAKQAAGGEVNDDMTVLVARLERRTRRARDQGAGRETAEIPVYARTAEE